MMLVQPLRRPLYGLATSSLAAKPLSRNLATSSILRSPLLKSAFKPQSLVRPQSAIRNGKTNAQFASRRFFTVEPAIDARPTRAEAIKRLAYGGAIFGGTLLATNILFNGEGREGGIPEFERQYLKETFTYTGLSVGMIGLAAKGLHNMGFSYRLMATNPWLVLGISLVASVGSMYGTMATSPENYVQKHALWSVFNLCQAAVLAPLYFYAPAVLARAGLYTVGMMGGISYAAATAKEDKFIWLGGPLLGGCAIVALSGLAPLVLPVGSRALAGAEAIWLYGGLAVFGGFTLYDVQKVLNHARLVEGGAMRKDALNESIGLTLDFINIFVRFVYILNNNQRRK